MSDDSNATVALDSEAQALLLLQKKAEARKAIIEANRAADAATLPDLKMELAPGTLDVGENGSALAKLVGYRELDDIAARLVQRIKQDWPVTSRTILIVTDLSFTASCAVHMSMTRQTAAFIDRLRDARDDLDAARVSTSNLDPLELSDVAMAFAGDALLHTRNLLPAAPLAGLAAGGLSAVAGMATGAISTLVQALRTNVTVRPVSFDVADIAVVAEVAGALQQNGAKVHVLGMTALPRNDVLEKVDDAISLRGELDDALRQFRQTKLEGGDLVELARESARLELLHKEFAARLDNPDKPTADLRAAIELVQRRVAELQPKVDEAKALAARSEALLAAVDEYLLGVLKPDASGTSPAAVAAVIHDACASDGNLDVLYVQASAAGGESIYEERWRADKALHIGGVAVTWLLSAAGGELVSGGVQTGVSSVKSEVGQAVEWARRAP